MISTSDVTWTVHHSEASVKLISQDSYEFNSKVLSVKVGLLLGILMNFDTGLKCNGKLAPQTKYGPHMGSQYGFLINLIVRLQDGPVPTFLNKVFIESTT